MTEHSQTIAFFDTKPYDEETFLKINQHYNFQFKFFKSHLTADTAILAQQADVVCAFVNDKIDAQVIEQLYRYGIRLIALRCAGYNNVDLKAAYGKIHVVRVPAYSPYAVAEHTVALILSLNRKIHRAFYRIRDGNFAIIGLKGFDMCGKTAGIIGTGKIGKVLAQILKGFSMRILLYDPHPDREFADRLGCEYVDLTSLLAASDIISLNCPLTKETYHLINAQTIHMMKKGVMLINTGRGHLVDTKALIEGLKTGQIGSAGLDVYEEESEIFFEDFSNQVIGDDVLARLLTFNNVLITSHQGFFTEEALQNIAQTTLQNIADYLADRPLDNEICYHCDAPRCRHKEQGRCF